jgi:hypothetical protein
MSKIQLKIMHGFCRITNLGKSHFNFSSKNYSSKVYTCFVKVVALVTQSTTKLGLYFLDLSTILYGIYKFQAQHKREGRILFHKGPWNFWIFTKVPLTLTAKPPKPTTLTNMPLTQVNMWHRVAIGLTRDLLAMLAGLEWSPASGDGGAVVAQLRALELRRGWGWG